MKGLIRKDFYSLGSYKKILVLLLAICLAIGYFSPGSASFVPTILLVYVMMLTTTVFSFDDSSHWDRYVLAGPLPAGKIVAARYVFSLLLTGGALVLGLLLGAGMGYLKGETGALAEAAQSLVVTCGLVLLVNSVVFPLAYRFGGEKSRYVSIGVFLGLFLITMFLPEALWSGVDALLGRYRAAIFAGAVILVLVLYVLSYLLSVKFYREREF